MDFKEQIVDRALHRAMHARGVVMAAGELQADGKISVEESSGNPDSKSR